MEKSASSLILVWLIWLQDRRATPAWLRPGRLSREVRKGRSQRRPGVEMAAPRADGLSHGFSFSCLIQSILRPSWNSSHGFDQVLFPYKSDLHMALACHSLSPHSVPEVLSPLGLCMFTYAYVLFCREWSTLPSDSSMGDDPKME